MKKFLTVLCLCLCSLFVFAACGVEGSTNVSGIKFVREVFYVDKGVTTFLDYRIYPSTAQSYAVTYNVGDGIDDTETYVFSDGYFKIREDISDQAYSPIKITISLNNFSDTCEVRMREYPTSVGFFDENGGVKTSDIVYGGLTYVLNLKGTFKDETRSVGNNEFVYKITSSDPSVIAVKDEQALLVQSTGRRGSSNITVDVCNSNGERMNNLTSTIRLDVVDSVGGIFATFGNYVIEDKDNISLTLIGGEEFKIKARYFSEQNVLIELATYEVYLSNENFFTLSKGQDGYTLVAKAKESLSADSGSVELTIQTKDVGADGRPVKITVILQVQFLT